MATGNRTDPYRNFRFKVEIDGITQAGFQEVTGLDASTAAVDYREGTDPAHPRKLAAMNTYTAITLKRGITDSDELWQWRKTTIDGKTQRKNGSIILQDEAGTEKIRWNFREGWLSKWTGPSFNASSAAIAVETLEITHEELAKA
jgi:phage tail-like protein